MPTKPLATASLGALSLLALCGVAQAQSAEAPLEITDCTTIEGMTETTHYVVANDLIDCPGNAIRVQYNDAPVHIDLNGRTIDSSGVSLAYAAVLIIDSDGAQVKGNYHSHPNSGDWGATLSGFYAGIRIADSDGVVVGHSGVPNGGIYVYENELGVWATDSDDLYFNHFTVRHSSRYGVLLMDCDSPTLRVVGAGVGSGVTGIFLQDSPDAYILGGNSGIVGNNFRGIEVSSGSDNALIVGRQLNRSVGTSFTGYGTPAGIAVSAENVRIVNPTFNQTGPQNTCDVFTGPGLQSPPTIEGSVVSWRAAGPLLCN
ncbi:MAG: hypothetical protein GY911_14370 [Actinomycetales bacterium]|nr:hypothetical protein [Actinomycetales bacterium]